MKTTHLHEESIFFEALDLPNGPARFELIEERCADDTLMAERIKDLLKLHESDGILDDSAASIVGMDESSVQMPEIGSKIGNYELLEEIGDGGMGVVFRAKQSEPVEREVAVKVIKLGMDTRSVIARFEAERQTMALMDHPYITQVYDAGATDTGRPYFVMELVRGVAINKYCDENELKLQERLSLFAKACKAIQHAHQKGIIHRDIKPTNILVTEHLGEPIPKIIDFGIAKATDRHQAEQTIFTHLGQMIGTPMYMSPEQADPALSDVDTRSDIYSLGCVLYELLTGDSPFGDLKNQGFEKIRAAIREQEPKLASLVIAQSKSNEAAALRGSDNRQLARAVQGELDWILCKALAKSPGDRYESAAELARDVTNHLEGAPIAAAAPTIGYRLSKFIKRNKAVVIAGAASALVLICSTIVATLFALNAMEMAKRAKLAEQKLTLALEQESRTRVLAAENERYFRNQLMESRMRKGVAERMLMNVVGTSPERKRAFLQFSPEEFAEDLEPDSLQNAQQQIVSQIEVDIKAEEFASELGPPLFNQACSRFSEHKQMVERTKQSSERIAIAAESNETTESPRKLELSPIIAKFYELPPHQNVENLLGYAKYWLGRETNTHVRLGSKAIASVIGSAWLDAGLACSEKDDWAEAERCYRKARRYLEPLWEIDSPDRFRIRLLISQAMLEQHDIQKATEEFYSIVSDVECMLERMPDDVTDLLIRLRIQISS